MRYTVGAEFLPTRTLAEPSLPPGDLPGGGLHQSIVPSAQRDDDQRIFCHRRHRCADFFHSGKRGAHERGAGVPRSRVSVEQTRAVLHYTDDIFTERQRHLVQSTGGTIIMIALASDHAGFSYKEKIKTILDELQLPFTDFGTHSNESTDYPDYGHAAASAISKGTYDRGILVCGTGIGMSIVAKTSIPAFAPPRAKRVRDRRRAVTKTQRRQRPLPGRTLDDLGRGTGNSSNFIADRV